MSEMLPGLFQASAASEAPKELIPWMGALLGLVIIGGIVVYLARRAISSGNGSAARAYLARAWAASLEPIWAEPLKTMTTIAAARLAPLLRLTSNPRKGAVKTPLPRLGTAPAHAASDFTLKGDTYE